MNTMQTWSCRYAGMVAAACLLLANTGPTSAEPQVREVYQDWTVVCDTRTDGGAETCIIVQQKNRKETEQLMLRIEIGVTDDSGQAVLIATAPLGVSLPFGLHMQVDEQEAVRFRFGSCLPLGCVVGANLTEQHMIDFKRGNEAKFTFQGNQTQRVTVPISLSGFTAALGAIGH